MCDGLAYLHDKKIVHRDIKANNILLTSDKKVKIADLGLAKELQEKSQKMKSLCGTKLYFSPEMIRGKGYTYKTDIWSLGCTIYKLCTF